MIADEFELRPPPVEALRWTPDRIETVGRISVWLEFRNAQQFVTGTGARNAQVTIRRGPVGTDDHHRLVAHPGEWIVYDPETDTFDVYTQPQFTHLYRKAPPS